MAAMTKRLELEQIVQHWERRDQMRRLVLWLPRALALGLLAFGTAWLMLRVLAVPLPAALGGAGLIGGISAAALLLDRLRARPLMRAVQHFDQQLGLQERTSTALELLSGRIQTVDEIATYQLEDAYRSAQQVNIRQAMPLVIHRRDWLLVALLAVACVLLVWGTQPLPADALSDATRDALSSAADEVREITESVANDTTLDAAERQTLLETLETSLDALETEPLSAEEAFAGLSQVQDALQNQANTLRGSTASENATYEAASQALTPQNDPSASAESGIGEFQAALEQMQQDLASGEADAQAMQEALQQAAQMMQQTNPQMAQALQDAASAMQQGDSAAAQQALDQAQQQAQQAQTTLQQREATAQSLEQAAQNASQAADNLAQSEQSQAGESPSQDAESDAQSGENPPQNSDASQNQGQAADSQPSSEGQPAQSGSGEQEGNPGQSDEGSNPNSPASPGENGQAGESDAPPADGAGVSDAPPSDNGNQPGSAGGGASDSAGAAQDTPSSSGQFSQSNNPDGGGETPYEPVYAPQRVNADGTTDLVLDPDASDQPVQEGEFQANPDGEARVPYDQVFSEYNAVANQAMEGGYIPLSLRDVVQDYFTSIQPD